MPITKILTKPVTGAWLFRSSDDTSLKIRIQDPLDQQPAVQAGDGLLLLLLALAEGSRLLAAEGLLLGRHYSA